MFRRCRLAFFRKELGERRRIRDAKKLRGQFRRLWEMYIHEPDYGTARRMLRDIWEAERAMRDRGINPYGTD